MTNNKIPDWLENLARIGWVEPANFRVEEGQGLPIVWTPQGEEAMAEMEKLFQQMQKMLPFVLEFQDYSTLRALSKLAAFHQNPPWPLPGSEPPEPPIEFDLD